MPRLLGLRREERKTVGLAAAAAGLSAAGLTIAASSVDALLFASEGVDVLPVLYVVLGVTMFVASLGVSALLSRVGRARAFLVVPAAIALLAGAARIALAVGLDGVYPALWLLRGAGDFLLGLAVWGLAGLVTDTRQAKRFFPLIGGAAVGGQVVGGLVTRPLAGWLGTENLLIVWTGLLAAVVVLGSLLVREASAVETSPRRRRSSPLAEMREGLRIAARSPLLRWMSIGSILFSLLFFSLYLPFSRAATERYAGAEELAGFFGLFFAASTAVTLVLSLFVMNRLLARVGLPTVMMVLPVLYLVAFGVLTATSTFALLVVFRFGQVVWLQGGASTTWEAVINTVPGERRDRVRAFLYGGPTQIGTVLAGVVTLIGERALSPRMLFGIGLVSSVAAVFTMARVRRAYASELVVALREGRPHVFGGGPGAASVMIAGVEDPDVGTRRVSAELLGDVEAPGAVEALARAVDDEDPDVRVTALRSLARARAFGASDRIPERLDDPVPEVRLAALEALGVLRADRARARALLADADGLVRARAAGLLLEDAGEDAEAEAALVRLTRSPHADARAAAYGALGSSRSSEAAALARAGLEDTVGSVRTQAARALVRTAPADGVDELLVLVSAGGEVLEAAAEAMEAAPERAADAVRELARTSADRAQEDRRLADSIPADADERHRLLAETLVASARREGVAALRGLALLGGGDAITAAIENLTSADPIQRANALEVIETVADPELARPLLGLWESSSTSDPLPEWRDLVLHHPDDGVRTCAAWALGSSPTPEDRQGEPMTETLDTVPVMERVVFLRRVPLFADLPPQDLLPLATIASEQRFEDADTIAEQGDPGDEMHIIVSGYVMVILREPDGHRRVLAVRSAGEVIGEMAVITSAPRMASLAAKGPVRLLSIDRRRFEAVLRERPETALAMMRVLCERLVARDSDVSA